MNPAAVGRARLVAAVGCVVTAAAAFLPWVGTTAGPTLSPGVYELRALAVGIALAALLVVRDWEWLDHVAFGLVGGLVLVYTAGRFVAPGSPGPAGTPAAALGPGAGVYLALVGSTLLVAAAGLALFADTGDGP